MVGEAGIGKTRLAREWVAWAAAQGALVLSGQAFEMGGRLPYQPLVEALRPRLEAENAPEDLLEDLWLAELSRLLPELRVRYPDLPLPPRMNWPPRCGCLKRWRAWWTHWPGLGRWCCSWMICSGWMGPPSTWCATWDGIGARMAAGCCCWGRCAAKQLELNPPLAAHLADLGRDLPVSQVPLQTLSQAETLQLVQAIAGVGSTEHEEWW